jgi:hypothetical protein
LLLLGAATGQSVSAPLAGVNSAYASAFKNGLERAQVRLERATDFWVDHSQWENAWEVRSDSYIVRTTHSRGFGQRIADALEEMLGYFTQTLKPDFKSRTPYEVHILPDIPMYNQYGDDYGAYHSSIYGSFLCDENHPARPVALVYDENETLVLMQATHSALHQFVERAFTQPPRTWISEGLASYFSFRWGYRYALDQLNGLIESNRFIPLREVINNELDNYGDNAHAHFMELGMLFYYLLHFREDTRMTEEEDGNFLTYLRTVLSGGNPSELPFHELITWQVDQLEADFKDYPFPAE